MFSQKNKYLLFLDEADGPHALIPSTSDDSLDNDPEFLELQEREQIVDKYERVINFRILIKIICLLRALNKKMLTLGKTQTLNFTG